MTRRLLPFRARRAAGHLRGERAARAQVSFDRIVRAAAEPENWLTLLGRRLQPASPLAAHADHAGQRRRTWSLQWVFQAQSLEKFEATPLAVDGVLYTVQPPNDVVAHRRRHGPHVLDLQLRALAAGAALLRTRQSRARDSGRALFMGTIDGHLLAVDAKSGRPNSGTSPSPARGPKPATPSPSRRSS